ncbi:hypothetical protein EXN66_Car002107 [Channa argus]|uniref:Secreted protein n=1 Tax=Channa argus TaxID=215402 RepID=A0A6G1P847_CHAAH|nr:hypothetical protein EXN66_Car002107 [Channa argus]
MSCIFFLYAFSWLCSRQTPLLPAIRCVRRIWCSEIAVCESMPLPVQTSSEGLKNGMGKKIKIK